MSSTIPRELEEIHYYAAAQDYLRSLPPEHFMEATTQSTQRKITLESFDLIHAQWPEFQAFSELLVQYPIKGQSKLGQVVPDNMVVLWDEAIEAEGSYDIPLQPVKPLFVLEYVSKSNKRKDYKDNFRRYEKEMKVPYFLLFEPEKQLLTLKRYSGGKYVPVKPNREGRLRIRKLNLEMGLLEGWVRFWFKGKLLPLPGDLLKSLKRMTNKYRKSQKELQTTVEELKVKDRELKAKDDVIQAQNQKLLAMENELAALRAIPRNGKHE